MKVLGRKILAVLLTLTMVLGCGAMVFAGTTEETTAEPVGSSAYEYNVMIDGNYVVFPDAAPQNVNGRIMVPFRAIFETLGAEVSFDNDTRTVTAALGEKTISFSIGGTEISITEGETTSTLAMDVAPFIDAKTGRTYVPTRFISEALGLSVGWDAEAKTAVVMDPAALFAGANEEFSILSLLMDTSGVDMEQVYKTTGDFVVNGTVDQNLLLQMFTGEAPEADAGILTMEMDGGISGLQQGYNLDATMELPIKMSVTAEGMETKMDMDMSMDLKMDGETMIIYMKSAFFENLGVPADTWLSMDMEAIYESMGMDISALLNAPADVDLETMLVEAIASGTDSFTVETYAAAAAAYEMVKTYLGDEAFVKTSSGGQDVYTATFENAEVGLDGKVIIRAKGDKLSDYDIEAAIKLDPISGSVKIAGSALEAELALGFSAGEAGQIEMTVSAVSEPSTGTVDGKIPADAPVQDYMELMESMMESGM